MNEEKEDPNFAAPNLVKDDLPTSTPMENLPSNRVFSLLQDLDN
jgi:hypothetical protein